VTSAPSPRALPEGRTSIAEGAPLVSIVVPCYNRVRFLGEALESALAQTHASREVIVVDDGSEEDVAAVVARYPGVAYVRQENRGPGGARNAGLRLTRGEYVVFLDTDDRLLPDALEAGIACFRDHPACAFVFGDFDFMTGDGIPLVEVDPGFERLNPECGRLRRNHPGDHHYTPLLRRNYVAMQAAVMYRRAALEAAGGFDARLRGCEDYDLYLRLARTAPVRHHPRLIAEYRMHGANTSWDLELMLRTALGVLRAQRRFVGRDRERLRAYRAGVAFWKSFYGVELAESVRRGLAGGLADPAADDAVVRGAVTLLRVAPELLAGSRFPRLDILLALARRYPGRTAGVGLERLRRALAPEGRTV
jgi:glycosyltransferase involved in cell wall biosynthesis